MVDNKSSESPEERVARFCGGARRIFANAEALYNEAELLGMNGHFARATVLHQISMEECSKVDTLGAASLSLLLGYQVDENRLEKAFRNHRAKNHANAYLVAMTKEEKAAIASRDWESANAAFKDLQKRFHEDVNAIKNAGLYVDFGDGRFTAPTDEITEQTAIVFQRLNGFFLNHSINFLKVMDRIEKEPAIVRALSKEIVARSEEVLQSQEFSLESIESKFFTELLEKCKSPEVPDFC